MDDLLERKHWKHYQRAYEQCIRKTSTEHAPWYILPADDKKNARIMLSYILCEKFCELDVKFPIPDKKHKSLLRKAHKELATGHVQKNSNLG
jgi:hypothetical protein